MPCIACMASGWNPPRRTGSLHAHTLVPTSRFNHSYCLETTFDTCCVCFDMRISGVEVSKSALITIEAKGAKSYQDKATSVDTPQLFLRSAPPSTVDSWQAWALRLQKRSKRLF